jgi:hypothetical protein
MTLVSDIIANAYRESNLIPIGSSPTTAQSDEALSRLNSIVLSSIGNEIGDKLNDLNVEGPYDESFALIEFVKSNARLILNLTAPKTVYLDPDPYEGQRFGVVDAAGNLNTHNLTLDGNGRNIEGNSTLVLSTNDTASHWLYRADTANWVKISGLLTSDQMPFPEEFDDYFITMLALRINPRYGQELRAETLETMRRSKRQIRSRYNGPNLTRPDYAGKMVADRYYFYLDHNFDTGRW